MVQKVKWTWQKYTLTGNASALGEALRPVLGDMTRHGALVPSQ
jgi:hypothetical protein